MNETGGECGQNRGSQKQNAFHPPMPWSRTKCSGRDAGGWLVYKPTLFHWLSMRPHAKSHQQLQPKSGHWNLKGTNFHWLGRMQNMCRAWPSWRELFLGTHADHPNPCRADPSEREKERNCTTSIQPAWLMRTDLCSCLGHLALRQWLTAFWSLCHMNRRMEPSAS